MKELVKRLQADEYDLPAVEAWLKQMASEGAFLKETAGVWWYFTEGEPAKVRYRLEPCTDSEPDQEQLDDYGKAGWKHVTVHRKLYHIYLAEDENSPELHTDPVVLGISVKRMEKELR